MLGEELRKTARENMLLCNACPVCNGYGCRGKMPGPGGRGESANFKRSYEKLKEIRINMRFLHEPREDIDSRFEAFGRVFRYPVFAAPIGMLPVNFGPHYDDLVYASTLLEGCDAAGICAFTGDGPSGWHF